MNRLLLSGLAFGALIAPAVAADMPLKAPPPPAFSWTGFYVGANAGWGTLRDEGDPYCINPAGVPMGAGCSRVYGGHIARGNGFIGGGQAGYNWQSGRWVLGVETDIQGADIKGSVDVVGPFGVVGFTGNSGAASFIAAEKLSWLGTTRGRLGLAFDHLLLYATGGVAYGGASVSQDHVFAAVQYPSTASANKTGWVAGGGLEFAFTGNWSGKVEGLFYDLGSITTAGPQVPHFTNFIEGKNFDVQGAIVRAGLNYRFAGWGF